jgi:hypothetical protein
MKFGDIWVETTNEVTWNTYFINLESRNEEVLVTIGYSTLILEMTMALPNNWH